MRLALLQFETKLQKYIRMGITIFKFSFGEVNRRIYVWKSGFTSPLARHRKTKFLTVYPSITRYTSPIENFDYSYPLILSYDIVSGSDLKCLYKYNHLLPQVVFQFFSWNALIVIKGEIVPFDWT